MIRGLHRQGYSFRAIARWTGVGYGTVRRAYHGFAPDGADRGADSAQFDRFSTAGQAAEFGVRRSMAVSG